jgi:hypothetical protein
MTNALHPDHMTPEERRKELAAILARGYLRLLTGRGKEKRAEKPRGLDSSHERSLNVPEGNEAENPHDGGQL